MYNLIVETDKNNLNSIKIILNKSPNIWKSSLLSVIRYKNGKQTYYLPCFTYNEVLSKIVYFLEKIYKKGEESYEESCL